VQWHVLVPGMCERIWQAFIEAAVMAGALPPRAEGYPVQWAPPVFEMVDPLKDALAIQKQVRLGLKTWGQAVGEMGWEPRRQAEEIAEWNALHDDLGLITDGDPRRTGGTGGAQDPRANAAIEIAATGAATDEPAVTNVNVENRVELAGALGESVRDALLPAAYDLGLTAAEMREAMGVMRDAAQALTEGSSATAEALGEAAGDVRAATDALRETGLAGVAAMREAAAAMARPRRMVVTRDADNRVTGAEEG
jgi:hypothetical protein